MSLIAIIMIILILVYITPDTARNIGASLFKFVHELKEGYKKEKEKIEDI